MLTEQHPAAGTILGGPSSSRKPSLPSCTLTFTSVFPSARFSGKQGWVWRLWPLKVHQVTLGQMAEDQGLSPWQQAWASVQGGLQRSKEIPVRLTQIPEQAAHPKSEKLLLKPNESFCPRRQIASSHEYHKGKYPKKTQAVRLTGTSLEKISANNWELIFCPAEDMSLKHSILPKSRVFQHLLSKESLLVLAYSLLKGCLQRQNRNGESRTSHATRPRGAGMSTGYQLPETSILGPSCIITVFRLFSATKVLKQKKEIYISVSV